MTRFRHLFALIFAIIIVDSGTVRGEDRHYMLMFASQSEPSLPRSSHTFAVFVKTSGEADGADKPEMESHCISWLPRSLRIELLRPIPVTGTNLSLQESIKFAQSVDARITMWGPFLIKPELYKMAVEQANRLNANAIEYVVLDGRGRGERASNCIHAVADLDTTRARLATGTAFGEAASQMVLRHFERYILPSKEPTKWLTDQLRLNPMAIRFATPEIVGEATTSQATAAPKVKR